MFTYDAFGNRLTSQLDGTGITARTTSTVTYDAQGRFALTNADALGHSTAMTSNADFGTPASVTGADTLTTSSTYDGFGRVTGATANDGTKSGIAYAYCAGVNGGSASCPTHGATAVTATPLKSDGTTQNGALSISYFDALGRPIAQDVQGFDGSWIRQETRYDAYFHVAQVSKPYFLSGGTAQWTVFSYIDLDVRPRSVRPRMEGNSAGFEHYNRRLRRADHDSDRRQRPSDKDDPERARFGGQRAGCRLA